MGVAVRISDDGVAQVVGAPVAGRVERGPSIRWALASLSLSALLPALGTSIAHVALPTLSEAFDASFQQVQWVVLAYLLAITTLIVSVGRLGDIVGRRRLLMAGIFLFTAASAAQGLGAAIMMALAMALVGEAIPKERTGSAMGLLGTLSAVGTALGPTLGGALIARFGWPALFFVNVPLGILALVLAWRWLPARRPTAGPVRSSFDSAGALLLALTLAAYALAMTIGRGRFGLANQALLAAAALGAGLFVRAEARAVSPLVPVARFRDPVLGAALTTSALVATVMMATLVVGPFYLARTLGLDTAVVGLVLSAGPAVAALAGVPAGRIVDRFGAPRIAVSGLAGMVAGSAVLSLVPQSLGIAGYVIPIAVITGSYSLFQVANNTAVLSDVSPDQRGVISGLLNLSRNLGLITGACAMGAVFASASRTANPMTAMHADVAVGMRTTFAVSAALMIVALVIARRSQVLSRPTSS